MKKKQWLALAMTLCLAAGAAGCGSREDTTVAEVTEESQEERETEEKETATEETGETKENQTRQEEGLPDYVPSVESYQVEADLSNVENADRFYLQDHMVKKLVENNFVVCDGTWSEFFDLYEQNRYLQVPVFVTTDSMMHTYHLYFALLQKNTESNYLTDLTGKFSSRMYEDSLAQYQELEGTEWEDAALKNVAFFAVGAELMGQEVADLPTGAKTIASQEQQLILDARSVEESPLTGDWEDYSQYKPRGYYEGNEELEQYFRAMMWYGRRNFAQTNETQNREALLMTLALQEDSEAQEAWNAVYSITSFFAGASDDAGYQEYAPIIEEVYGKDVTLEKLVGDDKSFEKYVKRIQTLDPPAINSEVFADDEGETDKTQLAKGFRFMGQRFSLDEAVFTQLCYSKVKENPEGEKRMLPDALDVPAAMGSDKAVELLQENGAFTYAGYEENLEKVQTKIREKPDSFWNASLYANWLYTLNPLLEERGEGYPSFMTNEEWQKKNLEGFLGSWTELKHDTVLYSKQFVAEMGGGDEEVDDRGYVEPMPELYHRLSVLTQKTAYGLEKFGVINDTDKENLARLEELADQLTTISIKELTNEPLTEAEFELIRSYGGNLEHFWEEAVKEQSESESRPYSSEFPAALVVDVATDPNGTVLEEAIGGISEIYVVVPVDGKLRIAKGGVFTYYQFEQPLSDRMTDSQWRQKLGLELTDDMQYIRDDSLEQPQWTQSYRSKWQYEN